MVAGYRSQVAGLSYRELIRNRLPMTCKLQLATYLTCMDRFEIL